MKKILILLIGCVLLGGCVGGNDSDYAIDRKRDFNDIFKAGLTNSTKFQAGPVNYGIAPLYMGGNYDFINKIGFRSGFCGFYGENSTYNKIAWARNKLYNNITLGIGYNESLNNSTASYYSQLEFGVGFIVPGPYLGFNPGELLDWNLGYYGIDIYGDDIGLPPTYEQDLQDLNKFFAEHNGNLSMTNKEQTVICHERERCRVYEFENYSLAVFPLYWQKYGVHDFILFLHYDKGEQDNCTPVTYKETLKLLKNKPSLSFNNYILGTKYSRLIKRQKVDKIENSTEQIFFANNWFKTDGDKNNTELISYRFIGFTKKDGGTNKIYRNSESTHYASNFDYGNKVSKKTIKITLPVNKIK